MPRFLVSPKLGWSLVAAIYLLSFPYHPGLRSPNELCRLWQARALVDFGTIHLNEVLQQRGMVGDLSCTAVVREGEQNKLYPCVGPQAPRGPVEARWYYPSKAPLLSILAAPVYAVLKWALGSVSELAQVLWSRLFLTIAPTLLLLWGLKKFLSAYLPEGASHFFTFVYALGTMALSYAQAFMSHQLTAVLLFGAFFWAWQVERGQWKAWAYGGAGLLAGAAVAAEYTASLAVLCIAAYTVAARWKRWGALAVAAGWVVLGAAPMLGFLLWYHQQAFGSPLASGYQFLNDAGYMSWHQGGFLGIKWPDVTALGLSIFSPLRGLLVLSPFLALVPFGLRAVRVADRAQFVFLIVLGLAHTYFTASFSYASWGWTVGPRHLTGILPFLILPVALHYEELRQRSLRWASLVAGLGVASVLVTGLVTFVNYVPDEVSSSLWGLALPLLRDGYWPVSWLAAWWPNWYSGAILVALLLGAVSWLLGFLREQGLLLRGLLASVLVHLLVLWVAPKLARDTQAQEKDEGAQRVLKSVWVAPPGVQLKFRGP